MRVLARRTGKFTKCLIASESLQWMSTISARSERYWSLGIEERCNQAVRSCILLPPHDQPTAISCMFDGSSSPFEGPSRRKRSYTVRYRNWEGTAVSSSFFLVWAKPPCYKISNIFHLRFGRRCTHLSVEPCPSIGRGRKRGARPPWSMKKLRHKWAASVLPCNHCRKPGFCLHSSTVSAASPNSS